MSTLLISHNELKLTTEADCFVSVDPKEGNGDPVKNTAIFCKKLALLRVDVSLAPLAGRVAALPQAAPATTDAKIKEDNASPDNNIFTNNNNEATDQDYSDGASTSGTT